MITDTENREKRSTFQSVDAFMMISSSLSLCIYTSIAIIDIR